MADEADELPQGFEHLLKDLYFRLEERDRWADHIIRFLFAVNGGGIAVVMAYAGVLARADKPVVGLFGGLVLFALGLALVGLLLMVSAYHVRKSRREARPLLVKVLTREAGYDYAAAFKDMGNRKRFPSKWRKFVLISSLSFVCFLAGLVRSFLIVADVHISQLLR
jgi:hypothetical protein